MTAGLVSPATVARRVDAVVVGGGIAGLAAARRLSQAGLEVLLLDASPRLGGKIAAGQLDDLRIDVGAESVLVRRPEAPALIAELGLDDRVVHPTAARSQVYVDGRAVAVPPSAMGVPGDAEALAGLLSPEGLERARQEPTLPAPPLDSDVAIGALVDERFGPEVTDRLLEPLLGGVYAGHARRLSFAAVNPNLYARARAGGPVSQHAAAPPPSVSGSAASGSAASGSAASGPVFGGLVGGIAGLVDALVADLQNRGVELVAQTALALTPDGDGYQVTVGSARESWDIAASAVVLATPAAPTGRLLGELAATSDRLAAIPYASMAVVALAVRGVEPVGSGLLVPPGQLPTIKAVTHSSRKWQWVADATAQAFGPGVELVRASVGRLGEERLLQIPDADLVARTVAELRGLPGWAGLEVLSSTVQRWGGGLPQYEVGHRDLVDRLFGELGGRRGLAVCGAAYEGVGIAACLGSADAAVSKITTDLGLDPAAER